MVRETNTVVINEAILLCFSVLGGFPCLAFLMVSWAIIDCQDGKSRTGMKKKEATYQGTARLASVTGARSVFCQI